MPLASPLRFSAGRTVATLAGAAAIALFAGCGGSDSGGSASSGGADNSLASATTGDAIFKAANCTSCHTLAAAGATGVIGPNLDKAKPPVAEVVDKVTNGDGSMPSFKGRLTTEQIQTVADYVAKVAGQ